MSSLLCQGLGIPGKLPGAVVRSDLRALRLLIGETRIV